MPLFLADFILLVHFLVVLYVVLGMAAIWVGYFLGFSFVRNVTFRLTHLLLMGLVVLQSFTERVCPLTAWENRLRVLAGRGARYETTCLEYWIRPVIFFEFSDATFTVFYVLFFALVVLTAIIVRPEWS